MLRPSLIRCFLFATFLCIGVTNLPAQEPQMKAPPVPDVIPSPPPDTDTLPPPEMVWGSLLPKDSGQLADGQPSLIVDPPQEDYLIEPPPPPLIEGPVIGGIAPGTGSPQFEVWRPQSEWPQIPQRQFSRLNPVYVAGNDPVLLYLDFDPLLVGKHVYVRVGTGVALEASDPVLTVLSTGQCGVWVRMLEGFDRGHFIFYCEGVKTILPILRRSLADVIENEDLT